MISYSVDWIQVAAGGAMTIGAIGVLWAVPRAVRGIAAGASALRSLPKKLAARAETKLQAERDTLVFAVLNRLDTPLENIRARLKALEAKASEPAPASADGRAAVQAAIAAITQ